MNKQHDFKGALERMTPEGFLKYEYWERDVKAIKKALRLADRLQSDDMLELYRDIKFECAGKCRDTFLPKWLVSDDTRNKITQFLYLLNKEATPAQLIKEVENVETV